MKPSESSQLIQYERKPPGLLNAITVVILLPTCAKQEVCLRFQDGLIK